MRMRRWPIALYWEKVAFGLFLCLALSGLAHSFLYETLWIGGFALSALIWLAALVVCIGGALSIREEKGWRDKLRTLFAGPMALVLAIILQPGFQQLGMQIHARTHLAHEQRWAAQVAASPRPSELRFIEGIPDGGVSIVHVPAGTSAERAAQQVINGDVRWCHPIRDSFSLCGFG